MVKSLKANKPCDKNCFECPYPDCINDEMNLEDYEAEKKIDKLAGVKSTPLNDKKVTKRIHYLRHREELLEKKRSQRKKKKEEKQYGNHH